MARTVLLLHTLPDGSSHYDWLVEEVPGAAALVSFRVFARIDGGGAMVFEARELPPHRPHYLTHEGPISGDRGAVARIAEGVVDATPSAGNWVFRGELGRSRGCFAGARLSQGLWRFEFTPTS